MPHTKFQGHRPFGSKEEDLASISLGVSKEKKFENVD